LTIALNNQRSNVSNMEKKQRKFDQTLAEAKAEAERYQTSVFFL
jgi:fructose-specific component phosphotransferase system IIB-like protein